MLAETFLNTDMHEEGYTIQVNEDTKMYAISETCYPYTIPF
jgi:hypothetical protein